MKLLIISRGSAICGGVESINNALCRELPSRGWDVRLGLTEGRRFNKPGAYAAAYPDLPLLAIDGTKGTRQARLEALHRVLSNEQPDVVLNMRVFDAYEAAAEAKMRRPGLRLVAGVRCFEAPLIYDAWMYRQQVDAYVTSGELIAKACCAWANIEPDRVSSIPGGVKAPLRGAAKRVGKTVRMGYVGRLEQSQKRIMDLVPFLTELDRQLVDYSLTIAGDGPDQEATVSALAPWIQQGKVTCLGRVTHDDLYERVYPNLDVLVHFAHTEGVTISPREAMVHGVVPVVSRFRGLDAEGQFRHEENALVFDVGDVGRAVSLVVRLASDPTLYGRLSATAAMSQTGKYSHGGAIDAWDAVFRRALESPPVSAALPKARHPESGRLCKLCPSPWLRQRFRDVLQMRADHQGPGGEWPTHSGMMSQQAGQEIEDIADCR